MKRVVIIGLGALGSHLVEFARNWDVRLRVVDFDRVEAKNTHAQAYGRMGLGLNKAQALRKQVRAMYSRPNLAEAISHRLREDNAAALLGDADLVIDATDNIAARALIGDYCKRQDIPCLHGCLSADGAFARVVWTEHFTPDAEGEEGEATCENDHSLPFYAMAASHLTQIAQEFVLDGTRRSIQLTPSSVVRLA